MNIFSNKTKIIFLSTLTFLSFGFFVGPTEVNADGCSVTNAVFRSNAGNDPDNFYHDLNRPYIYIDIQTEGCQGDSIEVSIVQTTGGFASGVVLAANQLPVAVNASTTDNFTLQFVAGEDWCGIVTDGSPLPHYSSPSFDCKYQIKITDDNGDHWFSISSVDENMNLSGGTQLTYDCAAGLISCDHYWTPVNPTVRPYETSNINDQFNVSDSVIPPVPPENYYLAPLPGFSQNQSSDLGGFLRSLFTLLIVIAGILAFIMIVIGAIHYATADAINDKGAGKEMIQDAILGLVLALGAWIVLNTINPNLASNLGITIPQVSISAGDADYFGSSAATDSGGTITGFSPLPSNLGLVCPMNGGVGSVPQVIDSFENKTTYRWGGKGGPLPDGGQFKLSPNEQESVPRMCVDNGSSVECRSFCPSNSVCLDCSGFVNQVRRCTGLPTFAGTSSMVTNGNAISVSMNNLSANGQVLTIGTEQYTLQPGDILAWNGHTVIYYGGGVIAESAGEFTTNTNIKKHPLASYSHRSKITHLIKVP